MMNMPDFYIIEITNKCNLKCPACPWHTCMKRELHDMTYEEFENVFNKILPYAKYICFYVMGEPFLNKNWFRFVRMAEDYGIKTIISTNGMLIKKNINSILASGLSHLQVALDGYSYETEVAYRKGADIDEIIMGLSKLQEEKRKRNLVKPYIVIQTLLNKINEHEIPDIRAYAEENGFGFKLKKMHYGRDVNTQERYRTMFEPSDENYIRTPGVNRYSLAQHCDELDKMVILSNGDVVPCCIDYDASCKIGNIFESNLTEIWMGEKRNLFVESFLKKNNCFCEKCDLL